MAQQDRASAQPLETSLSLRLGYAIGGAAEGSANWAFSGFNFIIYTIGFGLPGTLAGLAVSLSIIFDAISDPLIGYLSDHHRSRLGRRHPFIYLSAFPLGLTLLLIYLPPAALLDHSGATGSFLGYEATHSQWLLALWLFVFASLFKLFYTCYHLPHLALGSELTGNYLERTRIFRLNTLFSFGGGAMLAWSFYNIFYPEGPSLGMPTLPFAGTVGLVAALIILLCGALTQHRVVDLPGPPPGAPRFRWRFFLRDAGRVFGNRNYLMLFSGLLCLSPMIGVRETLNANMGLYYWELPPRLLGYLPLVSLSSYFVFMALVVFLNARLDKGGTMRLAVGLAMIAASMPVLLRSLDLLPANGSPWIVVIVGTSVFFYYGGLAALTTTVYSAIGDVVDEDELESGARHEGSFYAVRTFFAKLSNALGHLIAGIAIDVIGFPTGAVVGEVDRQVIFELGLVDGVFAVLPVLGAVYFYGRYRIDRRRHAVIRAELAARTTS
ncbi:MAG: MFS transporter [Pseudomonadota bacterium]